MLGFCRYVYGEVGLVLGRFRRSWVIVGTFPAGSPLCRNMSGDVDFLSGRVR